MSLRLRADSEVKRQVEREAGLYIDPHIFEQDEIELDEEDEYRDLLKISREEKIKV